MQNASQGNQRRRRMMMDAGRSDRPRQASERPSSAKPRLRRVYADGALAENQLRLSDLIPISWWSYLALVAISVASLYGLAVGYLHFQRQGGEVAEVFALVGTGNMAAWLASLMLLITMVGSIQVYLLRRHQLDDYRGHYRLWLLVAAWCCLLSVDAATGSHRLLGLLAARFPSESVWSSSSSWWLVIVSLGTALLGLRLVLEMRRSLPSIIFLLVALVGYGILLARQAGWLSFSPAVDPFLVSAMILLASHVAATFSVWVYARYCFLRAGRRSRRLRSDKAHRKAKPHLASSRKQLGRDDLAAGDDQQSDDESEQQQPQEEDQDELEWEDEEQELDHDDQLDAGDDDWDDQDDEQDQFDEHDRHAAADEDPYTVSDEELVDQSQDDGQDDDQDEDSSAVSEEEPAGQSQDDDQDAAADDSPSRRWQSRRASAEKQQPAQEDRAEELNRMLEDETEFDDQMDPERLRSMSKRQRKKWRRRQRQRRAA
jgi:hypothetical protein